jgi:hypothetical protein
MTGSPQVSLPGDSEQEETFCFYKPRLVGLDTENSTREDGVRRETACSSRGSHCCGRTPE